VGTFVIKVMHGGLGDHLFFSHLPRIAKESGGFRRVLISNKSEYRHPDYRRLIWESNPYVDGFCDDDALFGPIDAVPEGMNLLDHIMIFRGLDDGKRYHEPELYFRPALIESLRNSTIYDPNYVSDAGSNVASSQVDRVFRRMGIVAEYMLPPGQKSLPVSKYGALLKTENLEHYCAIIASAGRFICLTSGGATLAAALGRPAICLHGDGQGKQYHHSRLHRYVNINPPPLALRVKKSLLRSGQEVRRRLAALRS
jgi:hypothetical protein